MEQENNNFNENDNVQNINEPENNIPEEPVMNQDMNNVSEEQVQDENYVGPENVENYQSTEIEPQFDVSFDEPPVEKKSNGKMIALVIILVLLLAGLGVFLYFTLGNKEEKPAEKPEEKPNTEEVEEDPTNYLAYQIKGNAIGDFDLQFLKLENNKENVIYSPLSIKYALEMLKEGANGSTKEQIERIVGDYTPKKYPNNANMSFANAIFIKDSYKKFIKDTYINALTKDYNAAVVYDSFATPTKVNNWISEKTFKLINNLLQDISNQDYILVNALAIDMEWVEKIQAEEWGWHVEYIHEDYSKYISSLLGLKGGGDDDGFHKLRFNDKLDVAAVEIGAVANRYDIVKEMGESKVRETVGNDYQKWLDNGAENSCYNPEYSDESEKDPDRETFVNNYIKEINENYNQVDSSTDFSFYIDDNNDVKVFSKDLKEYSGTTLQYIAIMPTKTELSDFIKNSNSTSITELINKLKPIKKESFKDGYITEITGYIPMFKYDYQLDFINDLNKLGIKDVFDSEKADLSNLTTEKSFISDALHKATIEFSNSGIKAAAVTMEGGAGGGECGYDYIFKIPENRIIKIDLTFNKPYLYLIVDKNTREVWFAGSVYKPAEYTEYMKSLKVDDWEDWEYEET